MKMMLMKMMNELSLMINLTDLSHSYAMMLSWFMMTYTIHTLPPRSTSMRDTNTYYDMIAETD